MTGRALQQAAIALTASVLLAALATPAHSATYTQYLCQKPNGAPAPADGLVGAAKGAATTSNACAAPTQGPLSAVVPGSSQQPTSADLIYYAPFGTRVAHLRVNRRSFGLTSA